MDRLRQQGRSLEDYNYANTGIMKQILEDLGDVKFTGISVSINSIIY